VSTLVPGDPASVSALGADLARQADELREHRDDLTRVRDALHGWAGPAADAFDASFTAQVRAVDDAAEALAEGGRALQEYAVDLQHARVLATDAEQFVLAHGLHLDADARVHLPWGAYPVEEAQAYEHHLDEGQRLVDLAVAEREEAARMLRLRTEGPTGALRQVPLQVASAVAVAQDATDRG
jgi:uncharacterized protein YukE